MECPQCLGAYVHRYSVPFGYIALDNITLLVARHLLINNWLLGNNKFMYTCACTHTRTVGVDFCTSHSWTVILCEERRGQTEFMVVKPSAELVSHTVTHTHTHTHIHLHESSTNSRHQTYILSILSVHRIDSLLSQCVRTSTMETLRGSRFI